MWGRRLLVSVAVLLGGSETAGADEPPPRVAQQRIGLDWGLGSAVGVLGATYQYALSGARLEGGVGWGFSGAQLSLMPKIAYGSATCVFVAGFGAALAVGGPTTGDVRAYVVFPQGRAGLGWWF